jgi:hypothetical protein
MPNRKKETFPIYVIFAALYVLAAVYAMSYFLQNSSLGDAYARTRFDAMVEGNAAKPFVYRQLVPMMVRSVVMVTPQPARDAMNQWVEDVKTGNQYREARDYMPWINKSFPFRDTHYKRLIATIIIAGFTIGYMAALFLLGRALFPEPAVALFAPIVGVLAFSSFGYQWQYIYDIPCLCLSTACFYLIYTQRFRLYMLIFFLSCLNKETAVFSLIFFVVWHLDKMPGKRFLMLWGLQCAIYLSVKVALTIEYMNNSGVFLEQNMPLVLARDFLGEANISKIVIILFLWFLFTFSWGDKPIFLKRALVIFPCVLLAYFFYGFPHEYRVFFDIHGPLVLLATHTLVVGTGIAKSPALSHLTLKWGRG